MNTVKQKIKLEEGDSSKMYYCPAGHPTIGSGINLSVQCMPKIVRNLWLEIIIDDLHCQLIQRVEPYDGNPDGGKCDLVIFDMAYQMGVDGLLGFKKMLSAIDVRDYETASKELLDSKYAKQTPGRANRNAELLRSCI